MGKIFGIDFQSQFKNCTDSTTYNGRRSLNEKDIFVQHSRSGFFEVLREYRNVLNVYVFQ